MQQLLPDIKTLYQRKYIPNSPPYPIETNTDAHQLVLQRAQRFQQRTASTPSHINKPASFHIIKPNPSPDTSPITNHMQASSIVSARLKRTPRIEKPSPSSVSLGPKAELLQLLQVSHQELIELQSSMGGEKTLMGLMNAFFQKRQQQRQQANRALRSTSSQFKPMQNLLAKRYQEEKGRQFRVKKEQTSREQGRVEKKPQEKDLAPWSVLEIDPL